MVLVSTLLVFGLFEWNARRAAEQELQVKLDKLVEIQSAVVAESLWNVADEQIKLILAALHTDPDVVAAAVYDERDRLVAAVGDIAQLDAARYSAQRDIRYDSGGQTIKIGAFRVALTDARLRALARGRLSLVAVLAGILLVAVVAATLTANRRIIGRPLSLLLDSINQSRSGAHPTPVDWRSDDEIGIVVNAFNELQAQQTAYQQELRAVNDNLERRVEERTADLAEAEAAATEARSLLTDAIASISEGFALFDRDNRLIVANQRYWDIMITDGDCELGENPAFDQIVHCAADSGRYPAAEADRSAWIDRQIRRQREADAPFIQEMAGNRWQMISYRKTKQGGTVAVHSDITDIQRISGELKAAKEAAEMANEAKSAFLATMSHEIRTPLNGIIGMSTLLAGTELDEGQRDFSNTICTAAETLLTIIDDILDFSKVEAGALELERTTVDLADVIEGSAELLASKAAEKGLELACRINPDVPPAIVGDPVRLRQILMNLLNNAVKFTDAGEVVLTVTTATPEASAPGDSALLRFSIRDTGIGIPADRMNRLFKSFSQVDASTTRRYGGTGLGLVITKRLVELMGGEIEVDSKPGEGTTFSFTLVGEIASLPNRASRETLLNGIKGSRVLIIDDNRTNRLILSEKLRSWDTRPHASASAEEALDVIRSGEVFDVAIVDYKMPGMNGVEFTRALRDMLKEKTPPIILFSSASPLEDRFRETVAGLDIVANLTKPTKSGLLLSALAKAIVPELADSTARSEAGAAPDPQDQTEVRILLVDDNMINRKVGRKILERLGHKPIVVNSGEEAIASCKADRFDLILMDIEMPDMDGITATRQIRAMSADHEMPFIVALTANAMSSEREYYLKSGMDDYLSKPINVDALNDSISRARRYSETLQDKAGGQ